MAAAFTRELRPAMTDSIWKIYCLSSKTPGTPSAASLWRGMTQMIGTHSNSYQKKKKIIILEIYPKFWFVSFRQHKLEEALLFSGRFTDALQALNDWLYRAEPQLAEDVPVGGDKDMVHNLIDKHKVQHLSCILMCGINNSQG